MVSKTLLIALALVATPAAFAAPEDEQNDEGLSWATLPDKLYGAADSWLQSYGTSLDSIQESPLEVELVHTYPMNARGKTQDKALPFLGVQWEPVIPECPTVILKCPVKKRRTHVHRGAERIPRAKKVWAENVYRGRSWMSIQIDDIEDVEV